MTQIKVEWNPNPIKDSEGVIVGCTQNQEWLLPWWWMNFRLHNTYPVAFVNFGDMSSKALEWCEKRGTLMTLDIPDQFIKGKEEMNPETVQKWDPKGENHSFWKARLIWYKKPFALLQSPFEKTVWIDLDCQVNNSIQPLYSDYLEKGEVAMVAESEIEQTANLKHGHLLPGEIMYNAGVIAYRYRSNLIEEWAKQVLEQNHLFYADQQLLAHLIAQKPLSVIPMPLSFNWPAHYGINASALIIHWWGNSKAHIYNQITSLKKHSGIDLFI